MAHSTNWQLFFQDLSRTINDQDADATNEVLSVMRSVNERVFCSDTPSASEVAAPIESRVGFARVGMCQVA